MSDNRHRNYEILNLIGYGLAKFDLDFVKQFGFRTKTQLYEYLVGNGIAATTDTIKNRQDLFDPFFENRRKGWWQKGDAYLHRKRTIDSLFGEYDAKAFAKIALHYADAIATPSSQKLPAISPIVRSKFKQLQTTG